MILRRDINGQHLRDQDFHIQTTYLESSLPLPKKLFLREPLLWVGKIEAVYPSVNLGKDPPAASVFLPWAFCVIQDEADSERVSPADLCRDTEAGSPHDRLQGTLCPPPLTQEATAS